PPVLASTGPADASAATHARPAACRASPVTSSGRVPMRSATAPATGATTIGVAVHGSIRSPAVSGEYPRPSWKYCAVRKAADMIAPNDMNAVTLAAAKVRTRSSRSGSIGDAARRSHATNPVSTASPPTTPASPAGSPQPDSPARTRPQASRAAPPADKTAPGTSSRARSGPALAARPDGRNSSDPRTANTPNGTLIQKIQCQSSPWVTAPPTSG